MPPVAAPPQEVRRAAAWQRIVQRIAWSRPGVFVFSRTMHHIDRALFSLSGGRIYASSVLAGIPVVSLTTTGARSGAQRTMPVLALPDGDLLVVIASSWGRAHHPAWYYNLRVHPQAVVTTKSGPRTYTARLVDGEERDMFWRRALQVYPGFASYERTAANRRIGVFALEPETYRVTADLDANTGAQLLLLREIADAFATKRIDWWLFGGWAMDFHAGAITRAHFDIELLIRIEDADRVRDALAGAGFAAPAGLNPDEAQPFLKDGQEVGCWFLVANASGSLVVPGRWADWPWPDGSFDGPPRTLEGVSATPMSLEGLLDMKENFPNHRHGAPLRDKDVADIELLRGLLAKSQRGEPNKTLPR